MFLIEWIFDKMGYQKKIQWTSSALLWEDIEKPVKKVATKRTTKKSVVRKKNG
jgi:hypothetical protein